MRSARFFACVAVVTAFAGSVGCSSAKSSPTSSEYDDVAQSTAAIVGPSGGGGGGELGSMSESASIAVGLTPGNVTVNAAGSFDSVHAGVTYTFTVSCTDVHGAPHCGPTTNDAQASVAWTGDLTLPLYQATVSRTGNWALTGLQTTTATFNGNGSFHFDSQFQSAFRNEKVSSSLTYNASYAAITYDMVAHHPTGGSAHYTIDASHAASSTSGASDASFSVDAVLSFASDGSATLTLDGSHKYLVTTLGTVKKI